MLEYLFWISFTIIFYTYIGYGILLYIIVKLFRSHKRDISSPDENEFPTVAIIVAAYNEELFIREKVENLLNIDYPKNKLELVFVKIN